MVLKRPVLKNKPLLEAIFELRWELQKPVQGTRIDPHYKVLLGQMYDRLKGKYPFHEQLPTATMPDEIAGYVIQHRFRKDRNAWPLVQIGPGIVTLNDTDQYSWNDFKKRVSDLLDILFEIYPNAEKELRTREMLLRYINSVSFDFDNDDILLFLREKMKIDVEVNPTIFEDTEVKKNPIDLDLRFAFPAEKPRGAMKLRFARGKRRGEDALIWETQFESSDNAPNSKDCIREFLVLAHELTDDWFFKTIEGELLGRFT